MSNNLKILIATGIYPPDLGGPATLLTKLPEALRERGLGVKIITYSDAAPSEQERQRGEVWRIKRGRGFFSQAAYFWRFWRLSFWSDIIYATDTYSVGYFAYLIKKMTGKKYVLRFAGDSAWETSVARGWTQDYIVDFQNKKYDRRIEKLKRRRTKILVAADRVVAVSHFIAALAQTIGVAGEKISVIYNSVDFFGERAEKQEPFSPALVFAGRLAPWKGVEMLLRVVAKLKAVRPGIIFEILGDGPEEEKLKDVARQLGLEQNVKFHGRVSELVSHQVFARSTIFVLNTNYEGLPHSVLNALAAGLPVITTNIGGNSEVVADGVNGLLVPYNDENAWLEAISRLLADKEARDKFTLNGYGVLAKFSWDKLVEQTEAVFQETITKKQDTNNNQ